MTEFDMLLLTHSMKIIISAYITSKKMFIIKHVDELNEWENLKLNWNELSMNSADTKHFSIFYINTFRNMF